ncbi:hypothetical protein EVAR_36944_1 [Eumeta japonica]|uniref:Uncharacterized protein n=1 Tax=Eumeta variegata TaxID=151549 RepID=A0A4C1W7S1_EUMVA|nr:hypothetical protein EVAR_36944_1 [Eumeta japonica]
MNSRTHDLSNSQRSSTPQHHVAKRDARPAVFRVAQLRAREPLASRVRRSEICARPSRRRRRHNKKFRGARELTTPIAGELRGGIPFAIAFPLKVNPGQRSPVRVEVEVVALRLQRPFGGDSPECR